MPILNQTHLLKNALHGTGFVRRGSAFFRVWGDGVLQVIKFQHESVFEVQHLNVGVFSMYGKLLHMETRNPAVALVIGLAVLYFFRRFGENSFANVLIKLFIGIAAVLWATMLRVEHGLPVLIVMMTMWAMRNKKAAAILFGGAVASGCVLFSPLYIGAALGILPVYFYREEEEETEIPLLVYAVYPAALAAFGLVSIFL